VFGTCAMSTDITEHKHVEQLMIEMEKMSSVARLTAGMAHEINNPLGAISQGMQNAFRRISPEIRANIETANKFGVDLDKMHSYLAERKVLMFLKGAQDASSRAATIVKDMLQFSRKSNSEHQSVDLCALIERSIKLGATDYTMKSKYDLQFIDIIREFDPDVPEVKCCQPDIEQVLINILKNALNAMGSVKSQNFQPKLHIRLIKEDKFARIEIENNGPPIPEKVRKHVFEPFYTTSSTGGGIGLGLSVSYSIITHNHKGTFEVKSEQARTSENRDYPASGRTIFIIRLPL